MSFARKVLQMFFSVYSRVGTAIYGINGKNDLFLHRLHPIKSHKVDTIGDAIPMAKKSYYNIVTLNEKQEKLRLRIDNASFLRNVREETRFGMIPITSQLTKHFLIQGIYYFSRKTTVWHTKIKDRLLPTWTKPLFWGKKSNALN